MRPEAAADQAVRERALDADASFIVQAPAGSGKTELLTQRYLRLLATVEAPEEIIAITFTKKAAAEMRARIVAALEAAVSEVPPAEHHQRRTWELGRAARARDAAQSWMLAAHPARLRIQTVDSLNAELTRQMPLLSKFGAQPDIAERPAELYILAAQRTLALLEGSATEAARSVETLLRHLDNDLPRALQLLADMLPRRDQWLRHTGAGPDTSRRAELEAAFAREAVHQLRMLRAIFPSRFQEELTALARHAGRALRAGERTSRLDACAELSRFPGVSLEDLPVWRGIVELLLKQDGGWRATVDARLGFAPNSAAKTRMLELLTQLAGDDALRARLARVRALPAPQFADAQWRLLEALLSLLPLAVAQLQLVFAEHGAVDYSEVALRALRALGTPDAPTDLTLALDYRIRHLLVDEFQDTSVNQFDLLERLTSGWERGDGRTLFLVGDPMQSIYRFREAEVSLFLRAQQHGIGTVELTPLTLSVNFRSQQDIVTWVNRCFAQIFPARMELGSGAVSYSPAAARHAALPGPAVCVHPLLGKDMQEEAAQAVAVIRATRTADTRIAVLVRARAHLGELVSRLRREHIPFRAVEIEALAARPVVQDLMALTRALTHMADRTAWLAVLRAPWCGLTLNDLHALAGSDLESPVPLLLQDGARLARLSDAGQMQLARAWPALHAALAARRRGSLRQQVEGTWLRLAGPCTVTMPEDLDDAEAFFTLLQGFDEGGMLTAPEELAAALAQLFARPDPQADDSLQLMTIHKAKGLEFDTVIVPGLGLGTGRTQRPLLMYLERAREAARPDLLLAPLNARGSDNDPLYELVLALRREQEMLEQQRLLYVAATRARQRLHLIGHVDYAEQDGRRELRPPLRDSLLACLWPVVKDAFEQALTRLPQVTRLRQVQEKAPQVLHRLPLDWRPPAPPEAVRWPGGESLSADVAEIPEFDWAGETLRHVGTVTHRLLQRIAGEGLRRWDAGRVRRLEPVVAALLSQAGVPEVELRSAVPEVIAAVLNTLADATGRWILDDRHAEARVEYALSGFDGQRLVTGVIDRTFVDNDGLRWIIDYKTSRHTGGDLEIFLDNEQRRYRAQLERYARLMRGREGRPVTVGLYFPLLRAFRSWQPDAGA
ncbi:MAG: UvrD-helicase domain-containing protein [Gammaproteobacteria bacterium]|nr:UvrD-helicase domain-containing protein [Gammaproteobacteria bacterium]